jgi:integrase
MGKKWGRLPSGITIRENAKSQSIRVDFLYKGVRCREILALDVTKANITWAGNLAGEIRNSIERETFHYAEYFPNSPKLKVFGVATSKTTVLYYIEDLIHQGETVRKLSHTTIEGYIKGKNALKPLHDLLVAKITPKEIANWIKERNKTVKQKTITNQKSVLDLALDQAVTDQVIQFNPSRQVNTNQYITQKIVDARNEDDDDIDVFTPAELEEIYQRCKPAELNIIQFWVNTGVRSAEWPALKWVDVDFVHEQVKIVESYSQGITKPTKTKNKRFIPLNDEALTALKRQKELTFLHSEYVFLNDQGKQWEHESFRKHRWQTRILKAAGVRYRYPYQLRHTFATKHISQEVHLWKIANWMGHKNTEMIFRHYGSFIEAYEKTEKEKANDMAPIRHSK